MSADKPAVTNGEHWRDGQLYVWCGNTEIPIRKFDKDGNEIKQSKEAPME